ncbi:MAG: hypothetical protein LBU92_01355 [Prevotellaceae bacterium]|jgi:lysophospholipase L1-like esterase|nr:hypothetical protein [Prevotellaceae bacterium]
MLRFQHRVSKTFIKQQLIGLEAPAMVRPAEILLKSLSVFVLLMLVSVLFPVNGVYFSPRATLTFPSLQSILGVGDDYSGVISMDCSERGFFLAEQQPSRASRSALPLTCTADDIRALPIQPIEYARNAEDALSGIMFDLATLRINNRKLVRILHYGDSQLEADRVTHYLRGELQKEFGGGGVGYVTLNPQIPVNPTVKISMSPEWQFSTPAVKHKDSELLPVGYLLSSATLSSKVEKNAWIKIDRRALKAYPPLRFARVKVMLTNSVAPTFFEARTPTQKLYSGVIQPAKDMQVLNVNMRSSRENVMLHFRGNGIPEVHGVGLDYNFGVAVDNIPLRSSSGVDFTKVSSETLQRSLQLANPKLIVMQFGANVVPKITSSYSYYEEQLYEQLMLLKRLQPSVNILVVGVADMAQRIDGVMRSYPNIEKIRDAQKRAAFRAGCAFWDTFQAMGGRNSIVSWAYAQPALATKDFCHFSASGATLVAELLYRSFRQEFSLYMAAHRAQPALHVAKKQ